MYTCPKCGKEHTDPHDIEVMTDEGWDVQQNGCEDCWIETMCGRFPLIIDEQVIAQVVQHDPMA